jgi:hypothetical protein
MNAPFAARLPFKVFDGICNVNFFPINSRSRQRFVQQSSGRTYERFAFEILLISWLLADQQDSSARQAFAEYGLRCILPQVARLTVLCRLLQGPQ